MVAELSTLITLVNSNERVLGLLGAPVMKATPPEAALLFVKVVLETFQVSIVVAVRDTARTLPFRAGIAVLETNSESNMFTTNDLPVEKEMT